MLLSPARPPHYRGTAGGKLLVTSGFGGRYNKVTKKWQDLHNGVDLSVPQGTTLLAPGPGRVQTIWTNHATNGGGVLIRHPDGTASAALHMSRVDVKAGQQVTEATVIGLSGGKAGAYGSGRSTGPHVHWMIYGASGKEVDPMPLTVFPGLRVESYPAGKPLVVAQVSTTAPVVAPSGDLEEPRILPRPAAEV